MEKIRNKIITISGEPVSGKSTVVNVIKRKYEEMGYNVQVISVGSIFRELIKEEYYRTYPDRKNISLADIQTDEEFKEKRNKIDKMVDEEVARRGNLINQTERPNNVYIIDSRLAWSNIPDSYAIRLTVNEQIAGKRVFDDQTRGSEDKFSTVEEAIEQTRKRKTSEVERYKERYGVDLTNPDNYDLIVDTSFSSTEELAEIIIKGEQNYRTGKFYPKTWKSPALFLPTQTIRDTMSKSMAGNTVESLAEQIKSDGYNQELGEVDAFIYKNNTFLKNGHHRAIAALASGKTLIPYYIDQEDSKKPEKYIIPSYGNYYDWELCIQYNSKIGGLNNLSRYNISEFFNLKELTKSPVEIEGR